MVMREASGGGGADPVPSPGDRAVEPRISSACRLTGYRRATMDARRLEELAAEARLARERRDLYRARLQTGRSASLARMRELERLHEQAHERLQAARQAAGPDA